MKEVIFLNSKFMPANKAKASVLSPGFLYGWGVFETMRCFNGKIVYFGEHLKRFQNDCKSIGLELPYSISKVKLILNKALEKNNFSDNYIKLACWKSEKSIDFLVLIKKYQPLPESVYKNGFSVLNSSFLQSENSLLTRIKSTSRLLYELAYQEAKDKGFDEAILLNRRGEICEATRGNLFFIKKGKLFTPSLKCGCLLGITRKVVFDLAKKANIDLIEGRFTLEDLHQADEVFLTNSLLGIMPVSSVNKKKTMPISSCGLTSYFMGKYNLLLNNGN